MQDILRQMNNDGLFPPEPLSFDERINRFKISNEDHKKSGWYRGFKNSTRNNVDWYVFVYGDNHNAETHKAISNIKLDKYDKKRSEEQIKKAQQAHAKEIDERNKETARLAQERWPTFCNTFGKNEYLEKKGLQELFGARIDGFMLKVPMRDGSGNLWNIETVSSDGKEKKGLYGGRRKGLMHAIGELRDVIYIAEGFATGASIYASTGEYTIVAFNSANLLEVSKQVSKLHPDKRIVICGDNDQYPSKKTGDIHNVGAEKAEEAAQQIGAKFILPYFDDKTTEPTDFSDLYLLKGPDEVKRQIEYIMPNVPVEKFDDDYIVESPYPDEDPTGFKRKGTLENITELLRRLRVTVRYNVITKEPEIIFPGKQFLMDNKLNCAITHIRSWCERVRIPHTYLLKQLVPIADQNPYNPVITWIESKPWDGNSRLQLLYDTIIAKGEPHDIEQTKLKQELMLKWLISAVAAAYEPEGVSAHGVLVFQGPQYLGKTAWVKSLVPRDLKLVADGKFLKPDDKDSVLQTVGYWIVELGELDATFRKSDIAQLKSFLTRDFDMLRSAYAEQISKFPRRTVFFGSVNEQDFLKDPTGNRRFWTIQIEHIDYDHKIDTQQLWAEVKELYRNGEPWVLSKEKVVTLNTHNERFESVSPIEELVLSRFDFENGYKAGNEKLTSTEIAQSVIDRPTQHDVRAVARLMRKLKVEEFNRTKSTSYRFLVPLVRS